MAKKLLSAALIFLVVWVKFDGEIELPVIKMSDLEGHSGVVAMCPKVVAKMHFDEPAYDFDDGPIVVLTEAPWSTSDWVTLQEMVQVALKCDG